MDNFTLTLDLQTKNSASLITTFFCSLCTCKQIYFPDWKYINLYNFFKVNLQSANNKMDEQNGSKKHIKMRILQYQTFYGVVNEILCVCTYSYDDWCARTFQNVFLKL